MMPFTKLIITVEYKDKYLGGCKVIWELILRQINKDNMIKFQRSIGEYNVTKQDQEFIKFLQRCKFVIERDPNFYNKKKLVLKYKNFYDVLSVELNEFNN